MDAFVFDIDGTLANIEHRLHYVRGNKKNWKNFFEEIPNDVPIQPLVELVQILINASDKAVLIVTGRPETTRHDTVEWLKNNQIEMKFNEHLYMRKEGDLRSDHVVKREILIRIRDNGFEPVLVFDDRKTIVDMWREEGIRVAQVAPGNF
jgi:hypothetical protein